MAGGLLIFAACGADQGQQGDQFTPVPQQTPGTDNGQQSPGTDNGGMSPAPGTDNGQQSPGTDNGGMSPAPGTEGETDGEQPVGQEQPSPAPGTEGEQPVGQQPGLTEGVEAMAVVDHGGQLMILTQGQCTWTEGTTGQTVAGQPGDGSVLQLTFDQQPGTGQPGTDASPSPGTDESPAPGTEQSPAPGTEQSPAPGTEQPGTGQQGTLEMSIELNRGFAEPAEPAEGEATPEPASPEPTDERAVTPEDVMPFIIQRDAVEMTVEMNGQQLGQPEVWTGSAAPNGLSGYVVALTEDGQLLTINYLCASGAQDTDTGTPGDETDPEPIESPAPGADESPAIESPAPSP